VKAGDIVLKLDDTQARRQPGHRGVAADHSRAASAAGGGARQGRDHHLPPDFLSSGEEAAAIAEGEKRLFDFRAPQAGQVAQLTERVGQIREEIRASPPSASQDREIDLMIEELDGWRCCQEGPDGVQRILPRQRDLTRLKASGASWWRRARARRARSAETELQILALDQDHCRPNPARSCAR